MTAVPALTQPQPFKFTVDEFMRLDAVGAFRANTRTELIEGEIWAVNAVHTRHARFHAGLIVELGASLKALNSPLVIYSAPSTKVSDDSLPEPDIAIAEPHESGPLPLAKVRLLVEVSDTTAGLDLGRKLALYARSGVPEYWVADLEADLVRQMWAPRGSSFANQREVAFGTPVNSMTIEGLIANASRV